MPRVLSLSDCGLPKEGAKSARGAALAMLALTLAGVATLLWTDHRSVLDRPARAAVQAAVAGILIAIVLVRRPSLRDAGLQPESWFRGTFELAAATLAAIACLAMAAPAEVGHGDPNFAALEWLKKNFHVDAAQQALLQVILVGLLRDVLGKNSFQVSATAAAIFGLLHAPNVALMGLTGVAAVYWCEWFRRHRNLPAVIVSHAVLAVAVIHLLGLEDLRVGIGYLSRRR